MNYKEILGDKYKDGMSAEEVLSLLDGFNLHNLSDGNYVNRGKLDEKNAEISKLQQALNDYKQKEASNLTDAQKRDLEFSNLKQDIEKLSRENERFRLKETILESGFSSEECNKILEAQENKQNVAAVYASIMKARTEDAIKSAKAEMIKKGTPPPPQGSDLPNDTEEDENVAFIKEMAEANLTNQQSINSVKGAYSILDKQE